ASFQKFQEVFWWFVHLSQIKLFYLLGWQGMLAIDLQDQKVHRHQGGEMMLPSGLALLLREGAEFCRPNRYGFYFRVGQEVNLCRVEEHHWYDEVRAYCLHVQLAHLHQDVFRFLLPYDHPSHHQHAVRNHRTWLV